MSAKPILTTGDVARHCHVSTVTVWHWVKRGQLRAHTTPGRHMRIVVKDFREFLKIHDMPPYEEEPVWRADSGLRLPRAEEVVATNDGAQREVDFCLSIAATSCLR